MFISGGENVCPEEIETYLQNIPGIVNAIVVPVKDVEFGARPVAFVQVESSIFDEAEIRSHLADKLPRFKIPVRFFPWPEMDTEESLKYNRKEFVTIAEERIEDRASENFMA